MTTEEENSEICLKLLGWVKRSNDAWYSHCDGNDHEQFEISTTPTFTDWQGCGLILEALAKSDRTYTTNLSSNDLRGECWEYVIFFRAAEPIRAFGATAQNAVRSAALCYLRAQE
jgi:hypothetical protein